MILEEVSVDGVEEEIEEEFNSGGQSREDGPVNEVAGMEISYGNEVEAEGEDRMTQKRLVRDDGTINVRGQLVPNLAGKVDGTVY